MSRFGYREFSEQYGLTHCIEFLFDERCLRDYESCEVFVMKGLEIRRSEELARRGVHTYGFGV